MMKKLILLLGAAVGFSLVASEVPVKGFHDARSWRRQKFAEVIKENNKIVAVKINRGGSVGCHLGNVGYPIDGGKNIDAPYEGISFEVKGDGSNEWGCVSIGECRAFQSHCYFPLKSTEWKKFTFSFADMAPATDYTTGLTPQVAVTRLGTPSFGDQWSITWCNARRVPFTFQVRNFALLKKAPAKYDYARYKKALPLSTVVKKMKSGEKVLITCFGDSITAGTGLRKDEKRYAVLIGEMLAEKFKNKNIKSECVAVGGARTKDSIAWLDRDLTKGLPDVATMLIGYNNRSGGQNTETFKKQLEIWVNQLLARTKGQTAIILIPTVPGVSRWYTQDDMAQAVYEVAAKYNCTVVPLEKLIKKLGPFEYRAKYLCDSVHPNQAGHKLFASEIVKYFK